ncbi:MAG TPA: hypothetical protein VF533_14850 [Solirubrobacteraceae bacterium]|jgi:hypothetical protein
MSRRSLRPQLNQIRAWAQQGRTDAWIAHQLEVTVQQIQAFRRENELDGETAATVTEDVDLRAEDDAAIAAELDAAEEARKAEEERKAQEKAQKEAERAAKKAAAAEAGEDEPDADEESEDGERPKRRRTRRGGTRRKRGSRPLEGTFDHGEEGYGLWLDPAVQDDPVYAEHWAGHRPVEVTIEEDQIVIRRAGGDEDDDD